MGQYLIDTNVISDYLSATLPKAGLEFMDAVIDATPNLSVITQIELLCWNTTLFIEDKVKEFIGDSRIFDITPEVITHCVQARKGKKMKTPDAIIAATALTYGCVLITNNKRDFQHIQNLNIVTPMTM